MNLVRCPNCQTVFRLRPEQLETHGGMVRCGQCYTPFHAPDHLMDESLHPQASPSQPPSPQRAPEKNESPPEAPEIDAFVLEDATALDPLGTNLNPWHFEAPTEIPVDALTAAPEPSPPPKSTFDRVADRLEFEIPDSFLPSRHPPLRHSEPSSPPVPPDETGTYSAEEAGSSKTRNDTQADPERDDGIHPAIAAYLPITGAPVSVDDEGEETTPPPITEPEVERSEPRPRSSHPASRERIPLTVEPEAWRRPAHDLAYETASGTRWLGGLVVGILLGALVVQAAFLFRGEITRNWPQLRPLYLQLCERLGCEVPLPRVPAAIQVTSSHLESDPANPVRYVLHARIRNQASHPQAHPHLELTLTDVRERPVVRRVLLPAEWAATERIESGFQAGEEIEISLPFEARGATSAVGYRVYAFFP